MLNESTKHKIIGGVVLLTMITAGLPALLQHNAAKFAGESAVPRVFAKAYPSEQAEIRRFVPRDIAHVTISSDDPVKTIPKPSAPFHKAIVLKRAESAPKLISKVPSASIAAQKSVLEKTVQKPATLQLAEKHPAKPVLTSTKSIVKKTVHHIAAAPAPKPVVVAKSIRHYQSKPQEQYAIQLGSFASIDNAVSLINQLRKSGYQAKYIPLVKPSGTLYKVVVGRLSNKDSAKLLNAKLSQTYHVQGFVVAYG